MAILHRRNNATTKIQLWQRRVLIMSYLRKLTEKRLQLQSLRRNPSTDAKLVQPTQQSKLPGPLSTAPPAPTAQTNQTVPNSWPRGLLLELSYATKQKKFASMHEGTSATSTSSNIQHSMHLDIPTDSDAWNVPSPTPTTKGEPTTP